METFNLAYFGNREGCIYVQFTRMSIFPNLASVAATALVTESCCVENQCNE